MSADEYKQIIIDTMKAAKISDEYFSELIKTLAEILEKRDQCMAEYKKKNQPVVKHTNKGGNTNVVKNPLLIIWDDLNKTALQYWKELCLTPQSYKKAISERATKLLEPKSTLEKVLMSIE